jgi:predicted PurR-regulated permease PerM
VTRHTYQVGHPADHEHVSKLSTNAVIFIITVALVAFYELQLVLIPFVIAALISYVGWPVVNWTAHWTRLPRPLVSTAGFVVIVAAGGLFGWLGAPPFVREVSAAVGDLQGTIERIVQGAVGTQTIHLMGQPMTAQDIAQRITTALRDGLTNARVMSLVAGTAFGVTSGLILTLVLLFFFMISGASIVNGLLWLVPPGHRSLVTDHLLATLDPVLRRYFIGVIAVVCLAAILAYFGLGLALGLPHAAFLALLTGVLEAIPVVGPVIAAAIAGLVALQHNSSLAAIISYGLYLAALRLTIDQLLGPLLLGAAGRVHPMLVIFCFLAGGSLFGIVGVITAVPIALAIRATLATLYDEAPDQGQ